MTSTSYVLGQRHTSKATARPFESGIVTVGDARLRFLAVLFRDVGWIGCIGMLVFAGVLVAAVAYLWRLGALDWGRCGTLEPGPEPIADTVGS